MDDKKSGKDRLENVPAWVRSDPDVLAEWLGIDWDAEANLFDELGGRQNQAIIAGWGHPKHSTPTGDARRGSLDYENEAVLWRIKGERPPFPSDDW